MQARVEVLLVGQRRLLQGLRPYLVQTAGRAVLGGHGHAEDEVDEHVVVGHHAVLLVQEGAAAVVDAAEVEQELDHLGADRRSTGEGEGPQHPVESKKRFRYKSLTAKKNSDSVTHLAKSAPSTP